MSITVGNFTFIETEIEGVYTVESKAYKSRGMDDTPDKRKRYESEVCRFRERWAKELVRGDPYYNPNLTYDGEDFSFYPYVRHMTHGKQCAEASLTIRKYIS